MFHDNQKQLEYDFVLKPGADPDRIRLAFDGVTRIEVDAAGNLELIAPRGTLRQLKPVIWQDGPDGRREVAGRYVLAGPTEARFQVDDYDRRKPLVIDPVIQYSTYFFSAGNDQAHAVAADSSGNVYIAGNLVNGGVLYGFVSKLNPAQSAILYTVYLGGGSCNADARGMAVDSGGNAIVTGYYTSFDQWGYCNDKQVLGAKINPAGNSYYTGSTDGNFPTTPGVIFTGGGFPGDAFITKLSPTGTIVYSTYLGGSIIDERLGITVDGAGNAYLVGTAGSSNFPVTANAVQAPMPNTVVTGFVTKVNSTATQILYSTFLGGNNARVCMVSRSTARARFTSRETATHPISRRPLMLGQDLRYRRSVQPLIRRDLALCGGHLLHENRPNECRDSRPDVLNIRRRHESRSWRIDCAG